MQPNPKPALAENDFEVIIIGGSFAGLSAGMVMGRSLRKTLILDSGNPCNRHTPQSHNFITHDGRPPAEILAEARAQVLFYPTVLFKQDAAAAASGEDRNFTLQTASGKTYRAEKLLFATGLADLMPALEGFADCWGVSVLHCPYCHGYEMHSHPTGILANGDTAFDTAKHLSHWTKDLTIYTNGPSALNPEQNARLQKNNVKVVEKEIARIAHRGGRMHALVFKNGSTAELDTVYSRADFRQHCSLPEKLGCQLTDHGLLKVDAYHKTTVPGIFAAGDNSGLFRAVSVSVASGTKAGIHLNKELIEESFGGLRG